MRPKWHDAQNALDTAFSPALPSHEGKESGCEMTSECLPAVSMPLIKRMQSTKEIMRARISKNSLIVYAVLLLLSGFLLSVPGEYWPSFLIIGLLAVPPIFLGPPKYRLLGAIALMLSVVLIISDINAGKHFREKLNRIRMITHPIQP
jgi:hypothetical protein